MGITVYMKNILLSYPISGSHWLSYLIAQAYNVEVKEAAKEKVIGPTFPYQSPPSVSFHKRHGHEESWKEDRFCPTIFILRNPLECIPRHTGSNNLDTLIENLKGKDLVGTKDEIDLATILMSYHTLNEKKALVYYEDLIDNPWGVAKSLRSFFAGFGLSFDLSCDMEELRDSSLKFYDSFNKSQTRGEQKVFHSEKLDKNTIDGVWDFLWEKWPVLTSTYLERYHE